MAEHYDMWPIAVRCEVLEVSRSGFYASRQRHASAHAQETEVA